MSGVRLSEQADDRSGVCRSRAIGAGGAVAPQLSPDGQSVTWILPRTDNQRVTDLWIADLKGGEPHRLIDAMSLIPKDRALSEEEKTRRERQGVQTSASSAISGTRREGSSLCRGGRSLALRPRRRPGAPAQQQPGRRD